MLVCAAASVLTGCGDGGVQEVRLWMDEVRRQTVVNVPKIPEPKTFMPFTYGGKEEVDPYSPAKMSIALAKQSAGSGNGIKPDLERRKEPLENFPLDAIRMVGTLQKAGLTQAVLQVESAVFQAKVGHYIGQNFGKIMKITDTEVEIREIVKDASGEWTERGATLELQENKK
jgi:type IV pilus assembly protein PilP